MNIKSEYSRIILNEARLTSHLWDIPSIDEIYSIALQISEFAKNSLVLRSYNRVYGLTTDEDAYESVGAHTNLVTAIIDRALSYLYGPNIDLHDEHYTYREIMEAARIHDLSENLTGDIPDNGARDERLKKRDEALYHNSFFKNYATRDDTFTRNVQSLLREMEEKSSEIGKFLYCADKVAAIIMTLQYDQSGHSPRLKINDKKASARDIAEMRICDNKERGRCRASEMWSIDWFKARSLINYDTTGFFTALIIMRTLQVHQKWYNWRENDYK